MEWAHVVLFVVLVMFSMLFHCTFAQTAPNPAFGFTFWENLKASLSVMVVAFFSALAFMAIFSLYLRHCSSYQYGGSNINRNPIAAAAELCRRGFNHHVIDKCPILIYSTVKDLKIGKGTLECAVCLNEFQDHDEIRLLPKCHHVFHPHCIDVWLLSHMNCPVCRARLTSDTANIALATPVLTSNTESNQTTAPEAGRSHEMENQQQNQHQHQQSSSVVTQTVDPSRESRITLDKFLRSHSTGHSLVEVAEEKVIKVMDRDRDDRHSSLRLPEHVRKQILVKHGRVRGLTTRSEVVMPLPAGAWSSKRTLYRQSNNNNYMERWSSLSMTMTPPFVSSGSGTTCWTPLRMSFYKAQGAPKPSHIPPV